MSRAPRIREPIASSSVAKPATQRSTAIPSFIGAVERGALPRWAHDGLGTDVAIKRCLGS